MRIDLYLKLLGSAKTRMGAKKLCDSGRVLVLDKTVKPSREILPGETLEIRYPQKTLSLKVLAIPPGRSLAKRDRVKYAEVVEIERG